MKSPTAPQHKPGCTGKRQFLTQAQAFRCVMRGAKKDGGRRVYQCQHCGGWHITSIASNITGKHRQWQPDDVPQGLKPWKGYQP